MSQLIDAFENFGKSLSQVAGAIVEVLKPLFEQCITPLTVTERLNRYGWQAVDPHTLTPDERWEYQRWIMSALVRWARVARRRLKE